MMMESFAGEERIDIDVTITPAGNWSMMIFKPPRCLVVYDSFNFHPNWDDIVIVAR
jgi:hypothetical protein